MISYCQGAVERPPGPLRTLTPLQSLVLTTNPIMVKAALNLLGVMWATRLPLVDATTAELDALKEVLRGVGLL